MKKKTHTRKGKYSFQNSFSINWLFSTINSYFLHWNFDWKSCFVVFFLEWNNHLAENSTALPCVLCFFSISMPTVVVQLMGKHINSAAMLIWGRIAAHSSSSSSVESQQNYVGWENNTICWKNYHITMTSSKLWIYLESTLKKLSSHHQNSFQFWSILDLKEGSTVRLCVQFWE